MCCFRLLAALALLSHASVQGNDSSVEAAGVNGTSSVQKMLRGNRIAANAADTNSSDIMSNDDDPDMSNDDDLDMSDDDDLETPGFGNVTFELNESNGTTSIFGSLAARVTNLWSSWYYYGGRWHHRSSHGHQDSRRRQQDSRRRQQDSRRRSGGRVMTLYHQTSPELGQLILNSAFRPGSSGWCGGAIYFAMSPSATNGKAIGTDSHKGFLITAQVDVGRSAHLDNKCNGASSARSNHDSIIFNPGDGDEVAIFNPSRVKSMSGAPYNR